MKRTHVILLTAFAAVLASGYPAVSRDEPVHTARPSDGMLQTMPHGRYQCALPGDAGGAAYRVVDDQSFRINTASRYASDAGGGTYILRGSELTFTRGPRKGERYRRVGDNQLRKLSASGEDSDLLCTRAAR